MSGHSHAKTVARTKNAEDAKKSKAFSKMARLISLAAKEGGKDLDSNSKLKMAVEQAKQVNMPKDTIERAIKKGTGELAGETLEEVVFEALCPGGISLIIEGITDNKNRTLSDVKQILHQYNGKLAGEGSVKWMFERKGSILIEENKDIEKIELIAIEAGAEDIKEREEFIEVYTKPEELNQIKNNLEKEGLKVESMSLDWVAKEEIEGNKESAKKLFETLVENDAIHNIYSNLKL